MVDKQIILAQLLDMSRYLGDPSRRYAILGEGNTSAQSGTGTFYVKASGVRLANIEREGFVETRSDIILGLLERERVSDDDVKETLMESRVDQAAEARPSVETFLHAVLLQFDGVNFIGHTHPVEVNGVLCSKSAEQVLSGALFPDQIVYCGYPALYVPYVDPGVELAVYLHGRVNQYVQEHGYNPKVIFVQNHGLIALGGSSAEVISTTDMAVKSCEVLARASCLGGPNFLPEEAALRIATRPDEAYRKDKVGEVVEPSRVVHPPR